MNFIKRTGIRSAVLSIFFTSCALGQIEEQQTTPNVSGERYQSTPAAAPIQAKVIYYRTGNEMKKELATNVYVDGHFHTTLMPGSYTLFCIPPGEHFLGAYQHDAPLYRGKAEDSHRMRLEAGKTYFLKVPDDASGIPVEVDPDEAKLSLESAHEQKRFVSRAPIQPCATQQPNKVP
ncbi:hypothetical protein JFU48_25160 [Pseudomonas sp. TH49]|uniref:hypothetical protein n=1 Tax=Pseudomonas sp. TH49 TaxID=2796413 RepID=UPI001912166C|nr:hypothetical protein [Pseudomonas sp. TH49]MBK5344658.1 hypothetical protein [Pseudomonas sp. TH49]